MNKHKSDLTSLDFVVNRFFLKLFKAANVTIRQCQKSVRIIDLLSARPIVCNKFIRKYHYSDNALYKTCRKFV